MCTKLRVNLLNYLNHPESLMNQLHTISIAHVNSEGDLKWLMIFFEL